MKAWITVIGLLITAAGTSVFWRPATRIPAPVSSTEELNQRLTDLRHGFEQLESLYSQRVRPVERIIYSRTRDSVKSKKIAWSVVIQADRHSIPLDLAVGILLVENPEMRITARSSAGAIGLFQVMPFHAGNWKGCGKDLYDIETNICTGLSIYRSLYLRYRNEQRALLAYNGCVTGSRTPNCHQYPSWVARHKIGYQKHARAMASD